MLWIVWVSACAGDKCVFCRWALKSCVHVYILCESIRDLYFPLSLTTLPVERLNHSVCLYSNFDWKGRVWETVGELQDTIAANPASSWRVCVYLWRGGKYFVFPVLCTVKSQNTGMCMWVCACMRRLASICAWRLRTLSRKENFTFSQKSKHMITHSRAHTHTHMHMTLQIHMSQSCKKPHTV